MADKSTIPLKKAWKMILLSAVLVNGFALMGISYYKYILAEQRNDPAYTIVALVQTTTQRDLLKAGHLAELLGLSVDVPHNLFAFNRSLGEKKLIDTVAIRETTIKKIRPGTIHVDLKLREPLALLGNFTNTAFDADGVLFPLKPYFTPKKIPIVYIEEPVLEGNVWGTRLAGESMKLAQELINQVPKILSKSTTLLSIDVSKVAAMTIGKRQIVLTIEEVDEKMINQTPAFLVTKRILRLSPESWKHQLKNYTTLSSNRKGERSQISVVDLRIKDLAFISN